MHFFLPVRLLAVLLAGMGLAASKRGGGPMKRVKRVLEGDAATTTTTTTTGTKATKNKLTDSWATDFVLQGAKRLMNGDNAGVLMDMSMGKEMEEIFSNPDAAHTLLQGKKKKEEEEAPCDRLPAPSVCSLLSLSFPPPQSFPCSRPCGAWRPWPPRPRRTLRWRMYVLTARGHEMHPLCSLLLILSLPFPSLPFPRHRACRCWPATATL